MKKLLSVVLALAIVASCFTMITIFAGDTTTAKTVVNGDAESTGGYMNSHIGSGTTTIIAEPGNETNHVAMANVSGVYDTIGYDFSPAIIQDADKNLAGGGAGIYNVSFRYKAAEAGKTGRFTVNLASAYHGQKAAVTTLLGADAYAADTYYAMSPSSLTMTDQWQTYTGTVAVSEAYLEMLKACEAKGQAKAQTLTIRLDGSGSSNAFAGGVFNYYIDDMKIEKQPDPKGIKVEITEDFVGDGAYTYVRTETTGLKKEMAVDGNITKTFVIHNVSDVAIKIEAMYQNGWSNVSGVSSVVDNNEIPAGEKKNFTLTVPCNASGMVTDTVALSALTLRFNIRAAEGDLKAGNAIIIETENNSEVAGIGAATRQGGTAGKAAVSTVTTLPGAATATPTPTPTPVPVVKGLKIVGTTKLEATGGTAAKYPTTAFAFTEADIVWDDASTGDGTAYTKKSGTITKVYDVYNDGDIAFRAGVTVYGGNRGGNTIGWDLPAGATGHVNHQTEALAAQSVRRQTIVVPVYQLQDGTVVIKDSKSTMTVGGEPINYAPLNTLRFRVDFWDFDVNASMVIAPVDSDANDIIYTLADTSAYATKTLVYELPNIAGATPTATATATAAPTPTPVTIKEVVNGDAENGSTGWSAILGGSTTIVDDPTDSTNKVAMHVPAGQYHTVSFSLGAAIIQDAANGYAGGGAGTYEITFRAKAEEGKGGKFSGYINSQWHQNSGATIGDYTLTHGTYCNGNGFDMTDSWQEFTVTINITEAWLNNLYAAAAEADAATLAKIYNLTLRLDGSNKAFKVDSVDNYFTYYVDDVTITKQGGTTATATATTTATATATPTATAPAADYVGMKFEVTQAVTTGYLYFRNASAGITAADIVDGKLTKSFEVYNMNDFEMVVTIYYQNGWSSISGTSQGKATIAPKSKAIITTIVPVADTLDPAALSLRVDLGQSGQEFPVGTSIIIAGEPGDAIFGLSKNAGKTGDGAGTSSGVTELPAYTIPTPTPVAQKVLSNGDVENGTTNWMANNGGTVTAIEDPDNAGNHIIKFVPNTSQYATANFDLGPVIVQDEANGYMGQGAGKYIITFRAKAEEGKGGKFSFVLNSKMHKNKGNNINGYVATEDTYITGAGFEMTDEWNTYTITMNVTDSFLQNLYNCYAANKTDDYYKLCLRLDGSGSSRAFASETFTYYVDDVTIEMAAPATPEPTPVGILFESTEVITSDHYVTSAAGVLADEPGFTGKKTVSYTFYNTSKQNAYIYFGFQVTHRKADGKDTWADVGKGQAMTILPERKVTLTAEVDVKDGLVTVTNGGTTAQYTLDKLFYRFNFKFPGATEIGNTAIIAGNSETDLIYNIKGGYKLAAAKVGVLPDYVEASKADTAPKKENGNAEKGLVNWGNIHGGKAELVQPGAAGTANAVKLVVSGTGKYQSLAFDLGPWVIYDKAEGYTGGGAGRYEVTFYAKADKAGKFNVMLNSQLHLDQASAKKYVGSAAVGNTYISGGSVDMTKSWKKYTVTFDVKTEWYSMMKRLYTSSHPNAALAYQLALRFDGASNAFKNGPYSYQIDQISIKKVASYTNETPVGIELEALQDHNASAYFITKSGYATKADVKDDVLTKTVKVKNTGTEDIMIQFELQATVKPDGKATWAGPVTGEWVEVPAGEEVELTYECDVDNGKVEIRGEEVKIEDLFARFNVKTGDGNYEFVKGVKFQIRGTNTNEYKSLAKLSSSSAQNWQITPIYEKSNKSETGDALPVAMISTAVVAIVGLGAVVVAKKRKED